MIYRLNICVKQKNSTYLFPLKIKKVHGVMPLGDVGTESPFHGSLNLPIDPRQRHFQGDALWWLLLGGR